MNEKNIEKKLTAIIEKETDKKFDIKKSFIDNDMDSLDMMSIIMGIEKRFKKKISEKKIKSLKNINDLKKIL